VAGQPSEDGLLLKMPRQGAHSLFRFYTAEKPSSQELTLAVSLFGMHLQRTYTKYFPTAVSDQWSPAKLLQFHGNIHLCDVIQAVAVSKRTLHCCTLLIAR